MFRTGKLQRPRGVYWNTYGMFSRCFFTISSDGRHSGAIFWDNFLDNFLFFFFE